MIPKVREARTMTNTTIDAEELWQIINLLATGGELLEIRSDGTQADGKTPYSETAFWPISEDGEHVGGWWPTQNEIDALTNLGIIEPGVWEDTVRPKGARRKYTLTKAGREIATKGEEAGLAQLAAKGYHQHKHGDMSWGKSDP